MAILGWDMIGCRLATDTVLVKAESADGDRDVVGCTALRMVTLFCGLGARRVIWDK